MGFLRNFALVAFFLVFSLTNMLSVKGQATVVDNPSRSYNLNEISLWLSGDQASDVPTNFGNLPFAALQQSSLLPPFENHWALLKLKLDLDRDTDWVLTLGKCTHVEVYIQDDFRAGWSQKETGYLTPPRKQDVPEMRGSKTSIFVPKEANELTLLVKYYNTDGHPVKPDIQLVPHRSWLKDLSLHNLAQGFFQGVFWVMVIYNLLIFSSVKDRTYLYYVLYMAGAAVYYLYYYYYFVEFILLDSPELNGYIWLLSAHSAPIFYFLFTQRFIQTKKLTPFWHKCISWWIWFRSAFLVLLLGIYAISFNVWLCDLLVTIITVLEIGFTLATLVVFYRTKDKTARFFITGTLALWIGNLLAVFGNNGLLPKSGLYLEAGMTAEILLFSLGLGYRIKRNELEKVKAQENLIEQLKENDVLKDKVNRELEAKVLERTQEILNQKEEIETQRDALEIKGEQLHKAYKQITDSARYAKRIQSAMLGDREQIEARFDEAMVFFRPREILSGDFYWYAEVGNKKVVIAADCTGHGVPGAFLTVVANGLLNEIINKDQVTDPGEILAQLDKAILQSLHKEGQKVQAQDGIDMAILVLTEGGDTVSFSGAKNPMLRISNGKAERIKGSKFPIGSSQFRVEKQFDTLEIAVQPGDTLYLYSDGFQDQFGGPDDRKYMSNRFREFLLGNHQLPMEEQHRALKKEFRDWAGRNPQTDDVLVIGIRV